MKNLLSILRAMQIHYHTMHWKSHGQNFYGDHIMYERIYKSLKKDIDECGEKSIALFGDNSIDEVELAQMILSWIIRWNSTNEHDKAVMPEVDLQNVAKQTFDQLSSANNLSMGLNDFLMTICNKHETDLYLIKQRFS